MSETDQEKLGQELQRISALTLTDEVKSRLLGIQLLNYFGEEVVRSAIKSLGVTIR